MEVLLEIIFYLFGEFLVELISSVFRSNTRWHPLGAAIGWFLFGALLGGVGFWIYPHPIFGTGPVPGLSVVLSTLLGGLGMWLWGKVRRRRGPRPTQLATWYGGAAFALGASLVRFLGHAL